MDETDEMSSFKKKLDKEVLREPLHISAVSKALKEEFVNEARGAWNDNYSAYLTHLMDVEKSYYKLLNLQSVLVSMSEDIDTLKEEIAELKKGKRNVLRSVDGQEVVE